MRVSIPVAGGRSAPLPPASHSVSTRGVFPLLVAAVVALNGASALLAQPQQIQVGRCDAVFGIGDLSVVQYSGGDPLVVEGEFQITLTTATALAEHIDTDPASLPWFTGRLMLLAYPGSDVAIPGQTSYAPFSGMWRVSGYEPGWPPRLVSLTIETFGESVMVRDPDEDSTGFEAFEIFLREEVAISRGLALGPGPYNCGRLHTNGLWNAITDTAEDVLVAGKLCRCD